MELVGKVAIMTGASGGIGPGEALILIIITARYHFVQEGYFRENFYDAEENRYTDIAVYSLLRPERAV